MAIGIQGQYYLQFDINNSTSTDYIDFIDEEDLLSFTLIEEAGNVLPTFELNFVSDDEDIFSLLNDGNDLEIKIGQSYNNSVSIALAGLKFSSIPQGSDRRLITVVGTLSAILYANQSNLEITPIQSGIEAIIATAKRTFTIDKFSNVTASLDSQSWIQPNQSDRAFINAVWLHSNLQPSFPALGITSLNTFIIKDIKKDLMTPYRWKFTPFPVNSATDIYYDGDPVITSSTGFINSWTGYGKLKRQYNADTAVDMDIQTIPTPVMALTNELSYRTGMQYKFDGIGVVNGNTDPNYWQTYLYNLTYLSLFGSLCLNLSFTNQYYPIQILDQVMYKDKSVSSSTSATSSFNTGKYYVTKVARTVGNKSFNTVVTLARESINRVTNQSS